VASFHLTGTEVAIVAAGLAFAASMVNLIWGGKSARRLEDRRALAARDLEDRRAAAARDIEDRRELRSLLARVLVSLEEMRALWESLAESRRRLELTLESNEYRTNDETERLESRGFELYNEGTKCRSEFSVLIHEFELLASDDLLDATTELNASVALMSHHLRPLSSLRDDIEFWPSDSERVQEARAKLVSLARQELGIRRQASGPQ